MREYGSLQNGDLDPIWSFLVPVIADESLQSVQVFFKQKLQLNAASKLLLFSEIEIHISPQYILLIGYFFNSVAKDLSLDTFGPNTTRVK